MDEGCIKRYMVKGERMELREGLRERKEERMRVDGRMDGWMEEWIEEWINRFGINDWNEMNGWLLMKKS